MVPAHAMIRCGDNWLSDGAFGTRARDVIWRHMGAGESVDARQVLHELDVKRGSQGRARRLAAQEIVRVYTKRVRDWAIEHPEIHRYALSMPTRGDRAWALRTVVASEQLPGVDFDAVQWQVIVDAVSGARGR